MDDSKFGARDKRGDWKPFKLSGSVPLFHWPINPIKISYLHLQYLPFLTE